MKVPFLFLGNPIYFLAVILASVLASILSVVIAMTFGFAAVLQCAAVSYLIALMALRRFGQPVLQINK